MTETINNPIYYEQLDKLDAVERELYRLLKKHIDNISKQCFPSVLTLSKLLRRCKKTTKKYLKQLEEKGFIHIQHRKVTHKVTDNKFNETNQYTLLLEKFQNIVKKNDKIEKEKPSAILLTETDLDKTITELECVYDKQSIAIALKVMRKNIKSGSTICNMKNYLEALINKKSSQLDQVNKAIENSVKTPENTYTKKPKQNSGNMNSNVQTRFHNFEQRTSKYTPEQLEKIVLKKK